MQPTDTDCMNWEAFTYMSDSDTCNDIWYEWDMYCWSFWEEQPQACRDVWDELLKVPRDYLSTNVLA